MIPHKEEMRIYAKTIPTYGTEDLSIRFQAKNSTGSSLTKGQAIYIVELDENSVPLVDLAKSDSLDTMPCSGLVANDIGVGEIGEVVLLGFFQNIPTDAFSENELVYVSESTAGSLTNIQPAVAQAIGYVASDNVVFVESAMCSSLLHLPDNLQELD